VFALMLVDAVFPAASEVVMVYAGALAAGAFPDQQVTLFGWTIESTAWGYVVMALAGTLGYWIGSVLGWGIGLYGGRPLLERHGRWLHLGPEKLARAERWFARYEGSAVFVGRLVPVVRSFISIPAGVFEVPFVRYAVLTLLGTLPWCFGLAAAGVALGSGWERFHDRFRIADYVIIGIVVLVVVWIAVRVWRGRARRRAEALERSL
jgi:membrane protein DedA with SNARE-associated domain